MNSKKIIGLVLSVMMIALALVPVVAFADDPVMTVVGSAQLCGNGGTGWGWDMADTTNDMTKYADGKYFLVKENVIKTSEEGQSLSFMIVFDHTDGDYYGKDGFAHKVQGVSAASYEFEITEDNSKVLILLDTNKQDASAIQVIVNPTDEQIPTVGGNETEAEETKTEETEETKAEETKAEENKEENPDTSDVTAIIAVVAVVAVAGVAVASKKKSFN